MNYTLPVGFKLISPANTYHIEKVLGQGSFGITYLASIKTIVAGPLGEITSKSYVAIKEFFMRDINDRDGTDVSGGSRDGLFVKYRHKFMNEAVNLSKLHHPGIVRVVEAFEANNTYYYAMEYCEAGSLDALIERNSGLSQKEALHFFNQIASALEYMHKSHMLHLDLKPSNVMLRTPNEAVLIDFGLAKVYDDMGAPESSTTIGAGTPGYAPIEQANYRESGDFPVTMDIYALGATLYKMLTGKRLPNASQILNDGFPAQELLSKGIGNDLVNVIDMAVSPTRRLRYQQVADFVKDVNEVCVSSLSCDNEVTLVEEDINILYHISEPTPLLPQEAEPTNPPKSYITEPTAVKRMSRLVRNIVLALILAIPVALIVVIVVNVNDVETKLSASSQVSVESDARRVVESYYEYLLACDYSSLTQMFPQTVSKFYNMTNVDREIVINNIKSYDSLFGIAKDSKSIDIVDGTFSAKEIDGDIHVIYKVEYSFVKMRSDRAEYKWFLLEMNVVMNKLYQIKSIDEKILDKG